MISREQVIIYFTLEAAIGVYLQTIKDMIIDYACTYCRKAHETLDALITMLR